ncbi:unnamed protein product [Vitrella brassicaformis CCMP3155]|uniref:Ubiquinol-cytochrome c chaperone domain-containing protein n=1 Tax=Vitrella brassicaformis (strain CCMP3155) TaxID=1169540 RepID=A0A0G4EUV4_VITBC|nr:unnamed protein product [Vitrella brassicaformis CCMP3155]|mmetsp:Transcript_10366/g.25072  ORF Transcript_10366/g.25072 Transcript_10366/m.25072 type:complete len:356 (+) Transcript_10366:1543-2610(+)|eukprot:CEM02380.1 unnamed protein product [Vitrella brassicaformis CCMP3155]
MKILPSSRSPLRLSTRLSSTLASRTEPPFPITPPPRKIILPGSSAFQHRGDSQRLIRPFDRSGGLRRPFSTAGDSAQAARAVEDDGLDVDEQTEPKVWWEETEAEGIRLILSEEDIEEFRRDHERLVADPRWQITEAEVEACIKRRGLKLDTIGRKIGFSIYRCMLFPGSFSFTFHWLVAMMDQIARAELRDRFNIVSWGDSFAMNIYWYMIHAYALNRRLKVECEDSLHLRFWEDVWKFCKYKLLNESARELLFNQATQEMKNYVLGMCVALDGCWDENDRVFGQMRYVLWMNLYSGQIDRRSEVLHEVTVYLMRLMQFVRLMEKDTFYRGIFALPDMPDLPPPTSNTRSERVI